MRISRVVLATVIACSVALFAPAVEAVTSERGGIGAAPTTTPLPDDVRPTPSRREREMRAQLRELAQAWADGGGTFGFPFWEKASQRWTRGEITTPMYREYVTGYRDLLDAGCDLVDQVDVDHDASREAKGHVFDACERRVDALRSLQRSLDEQIRRDSSDPEVDRVRIEERIVEYDLETVDALQDSYRHARLAMNIAQAELDRAGLERLPEDAFV